MCVCTFATSVLVCLCKYCDPYCLYMIPHLYIRINFTRLCSPKTRLLFPELLYPVFLSNVPLGGVTKFKKLIQPPQLLSLAPLIGEKDEDALKEGI